MELNVSKQITFNDKITALEQTNMYLERYIYKFTNGGNEL